MRQNKAHRHSGEADEETTQQESGGQPEATAQRERDKLADDTEATLDEIDDVLEDNAEEFVRSYVQKGGE